jgi:spore coat polysaccharide biosynthesis protein SpsF
MTFDIMSKTTVMIQARLGSNRLPRKTLAKIQDKPTIWHVINRVKKIKNIDQVILITTNQISDKILLDVAKENNILGFTGSENDVLKRHYDCAVQFHADPIIRITGDCPLLDPKISSEILQFFLKNKYDYVSNTIFPSFPDGLDTEVFSFNALQKAHLESKLPSEREHVTTYFTKNPKKFKIKNFPNTTDLSNLRWTVDRIEDLKFIRKIYHYAKPKTVFSMNTVLKILKNHPNLSKINTNISRNEGHISSSKKDKLFLKFF